MKYSTPNNISSISLSLGNLHFDKGEYKEALGYYQKLYELNPNSYNAIVNIANTSYNMSRFIQSGGDCAEFGLALQFDCQPVSENGELETVPALCVEGFCPERG